MSGEPVSPVLAALRTATAERHRAVDRCMPLSKLQPTIADYMEHVQLMRAWLLPMERRIDASRCAQSALIDADLADAGIFIENENPGVDLPEWPPPATAAYSWGARYVVEGSRLGAATLYRRLRYALRPLELRYLRGDADDPMTRWPQFLRELGDAVRTSVEIADACQGARDSFDALLALNSRTQPQASGVSART